jgi:hypothetical protein
VSRYAPADCRDWFSFAIGCEAWSDSRQSGKDEFARHRFHTTQTLHLCRRQSQTGHFRELGADAIEQMFVRHDGHLRQQSTLGQIAVLVPLGNGNSRAQPLRSRYTTLEALYV